MKRLLWKVGGVFALACVIAAGIPSKAEASFMLAVCNDAACLGGGDVFVTDDLPGDLDPGNPGSISYVGGFGGFTINVDTALSKPGQGSAANPKISLLWTVSAPGAADMWLYTGDTDFTGSGHVYFDANSSMVGSPVVVRPVAFGGDDNSNLNIAPVLVDLGNQSGAFNVGGVGAWVGAAANPYSLAIGVRLSAAAGGASTGDATLMVPEPAAIGLLGLGLLGFAAAWRRRK